MRKALIHRTIKYLSIQNYSDITELVICFSIAVTVSYQAIYVYIYIYLFMVRSIGTIDKYDQS